MMRTIQLGVACMAVLFATAGRSEAGIITFESFANAGTDYDSYASPFDVDGYRFTGNGVGNDYLIHQTGSTDFAGSTALAPFRDDTHTFQRIDGSPFSLVSFDYAETYRVFGAGSVTFTGIFAGGGSINKVVTNDGIFGFETATFAGFNNLSSVSFSFGGSDDVRFQLDNINVNVAAVPEPSSLAMFGIGAGVMGLVSIRRRRRERKQAATA
ncbi:PEP-CTERM sorting domain-containing protein [Rubripirellula sp.]|nr:PEP-CTERM sorting domain-containing protein [Rubripirellula sp.]